MLPLTRDGEYTFTAIANDADIPTQTLTFSLVGAPEAAIDPYWCLYLDADGSTGARHLYL